MVLDWRFTRAIQLFCQPQATGKQKETAEDLARINPKTLNKTEKIMYGQEITILFPTFEEETE